MSSGQVHVELGPASEGISHLAQQGIRWDLAFIDADKTGYLGYYKQVCCLSPAVQKLSILVQDIPAFMNLQHFV